MVLIIKPVSAQLTKDLDLFGKMDPYCVIIIGQQKQRTKAHQGGGKKPQWYDTLQFQSRDSIMKVQVYDDDLGKDDFIGEGTVNLNQLFNNPMRTQNQYVDLVRHGKSSGRVLISMEYQGPPMGGNNGNMGYGQNNWGNNPNNNGWGNNGPNNGWNNNGPNNWGNGPNGNWGNNPNNGWNNNPNNGWGNNGPNNGWNNNGPKNWGNGPNGNWGNNPNNGWNNNNPNNGWNNNGPNNNGWNNNGW